MWEIINNVSKIKVQLPTFLAFQLLGSLKAPEGYSYIY